MPPLTPQASRLKPDLGCFHGLARESQHFQTLISQPEPRNIAERVKTCKYRGYGDNEDERVSNIPVYSLLSTVYYACDVLLNISGMAVRSNPCLQAVYYCGRVF